MDVFTEDHGVWLTLGAFALQLVHERGIENESAFLEPQAVAVLNENSHSDGVHQRYSLAPRIPGIMVLQPNREDQHAADP